MRDPRERFALANRHLIEADQRIADQRLRIERLLQAGHDTGASENFLRLLLETRQAMLVHRNLPELEVAEWPALHPEH
jgi:hypothetical protein